ncbi:hypothetical protein [Fibrella aquatica]|uniref:hypothetical protein n=1 Tax=Fibrella aquatica TaxID=3242487 RepID=UPI003521C92D
MKTKKWHEALPRLKKRYVALIVVFTLPNLPYGRQVINTQLNHFLYVTRYGQWIEEWEFFGWRYKDRITAFDKYCQHPYYKKDSVLYRVDAINPLKFWRWYDYTTHPRWKLPYNSQPDTLPINNHPIGSEPRPLPK